MHNGKGTQQLSMVFLFILLSSTFFVATDDTSAAQAGDYTYTIDGDIATITGYSGPGGAIVIPSALDGYEVGAIGNRSFENHGSITSVIISGNVSVIGEYAFSSCANLTNVTIPGNVTVIGNGAFLYCYALTSIEVNASNPSYSSLDGILYDKNLTTLYQCPGGKTGSITIPDNVTSIGSRAFNTCPFVTSIIVPQNVTSIGEYAFIQCQSLTSIEVNVSNSNYSSIDGMLYDKNITSLVQCPGGMVGTLTLSDSVTSIGNWACSYCPSLTSVIVPGNVTSIGFAAFYSSSSLSSITFQGTVAPSYVGDQWIVGTGPGLIGHAYAASDFPVAGAYFFGLLMGSEISIVPSAPIDPTANLVDGQAVLTWNVPISDGGYVIINYSVYRSTAENGTYVQIISVTSMNYTDTNITADQTYWYKIVAVNENGEGTMSGTVSVAVPPDSDPTLIYVAVIVLAAIMIVLAFIVLKRKNKK
jgi:hypothetical protein